MLEKLKSSGEWPMTNSTGVEFCHDFTDYKSQFEQSKSLFQFPMLATHVIHGRNLDYDFDCSNCVLSFVSHGSISALIALSVCCYVKTAIVRLATSSIAATPIIIRHVFRCVIFPSSWWAYESIFKLSRKFLTLFPKMHHVFNKTNTKFGYASQFMHSQFEVATHKRIRRNNNKPHDAIC